MTFIQTCLKQTYRRRLLHCSDLWCVCSGILGQAESSPVLKKHEGIEQCDKCSYKYIYQESINRTHSDLYFIVLTVRELLWRRVVWGCTLFMYMPWFSSFATNVHSRKKPKVIYNGIVSGHIREKASMQVVWLQAAYI